MVATAAAAVIGDNEVKAVAMMTSTGTAVMAMATVMATVMGTATAMANGDDG